MPDTAFPRVSRGKLHDGGNHVPQGIIACPTHRSQECHDSSVHGGTLHDDGKFHDGDNHVSTMAVSSTMEVRSMMEVSSTTLSMAVSFTMGAAMSHEGV